MLVAYAFFFTVQMTIGAAQVSRYITPALVALEVLAAVGLVGVLNVAGCALRGRADWLARALPARGRRTRRAYPWDSPCANVGLAVLSRKTRRART